MSLNKVTLIGNVGNVEVRQTASGVKVANISVATNQKGYTKRDGTQVEERTEWHRVVLWRRLAEVVEQYVKKGQSVFIEGELRSRKYTDQSGVEHYVTEIMASQMQMLGKSAETATAKGEESAPAPVATPVKVQEQQPFEGAFQDTDGLPF